jgi:hypothetical protein
MQYLLTEDELKELKRSAEGGTQVEDFICYFRHALSVKLVKVAHRDSFSMPGDAVVALSDLKQAVEEAESEAQAHVRKKTK